MKLSFEHLEVEPLLREAIGKTEVAVL